MENDLFVQRGFLVSKDIAMLEGDGWQATVSPSVKAEPEDVSDEFFAALPGIGYLTEVNIEPISAPTKVINEYKGILGKR